MKKHSFTSSSGAGGGVSGRKNAVADYSGTGASRAFSVAPASNKTTEGGAYDDDLTALEGDKGEPVGNENSRYAQAESGEYEQHIGHAQPLKTSGTATNVIGGPASGRSYAVARPRRAGAKHL